MTDLEKLGLWYQLSRSKYLGPVRFRALWQGLEGDLGRAFTMSAEDLLSLKGAVTTQNIKGIHEQRNKAEESRKFMMHQLTLAEQSGGGIITLDDPRYPHILRESKMCHPLLYYIGDIQKFTHVEKTIAIVGTREPASESAAFARRTAYELARRGWVMVSGMAKGIDSQAHQGALDAAGGTIAVLGCGPDIVYPHECDDLYREIKLKGLVLSEYPFGTKPEDWKLKKRNKTTVALSRAKLIVETGNKGGTMNAVKASVEQKRPFFTILPPWPCDQSGNKEAVDRGAVVLGMWDSDMIAQIENIAHP